MMSLSFATWFPWIGTPVCIVILGAIVWWIESHRNLEEEDYEPIVFDPKQGGDK